MTAEDLIKFSDSIAETFNRGEIRAPVHLYDGCAQEMVEAFHAVRPQDWVCCSWRSHWQCLLKGVPEDELRAEIMAGRSISLCFPKYKVISSAIVGGILPIAVGLAMAAKRARREEIIHCWMGDMTALTGIAHECLKYAGNWNLPIRFIVEDNDKSVCTPTRLVWGITENPAPPIVVGYSYKPKFPHAGAGKRVQF